MHIDELKISSFRSFKSPFTIRLNAGLNVIVGENGAGKTGIISALRQLFVDSEAGRYLVSDQDFHLGFEPDAVRAREFEITAHFDGLSHTEKLAFLNWEDVSGRVVVNLHVQNQTYRGRPKRTLWAGKSKSSVEPETLDLIRCVYLPPLRNAEERLSNGPRSRLAKLLKVICKKDLIKHDEDGTQHPLVEKVAAFNNDLANSDDYAIKAANALIVNSLKEAIGENFAQNTRLQFSETDFSRIVEGLRLLFFPNLNIVDEKSFRDLQENSLGFNNLIYIASILAELSLVATAQDEDNGFFHLLLIEEPEAHLHPQLQQRLLGYLLETAKKESVQVIVTTHSTVLASAVPVNSLIHVACNPDPTATPLSLCGLSTDSQNFINRWLDVTKSNLLFARGLIFVEGIAEAIVLPELAKFVLKNQLKGKNTLSDLGVSVINLNGIYFKHFMQLFCNINAEFPAALSIPVRCAGLTDRDPPKTSKIVVDGKEIVSDIKPFDGNIPEGTNHAITLIGDIEKSKNARLYVGIYKTFEYDLAMEGNNIPLIAKVLHDAWPTDGGNKAKLLSLSNEKIDWTNEASEKKATAAHDLLELIDSNDMGKGWFAQLLADQLVKEKISLTVPKYISDAINWSCSING